MKLEDVRKEIDALDPQIKTLILRRMDCSLEVAKAKQAAGGDHNLSEGPGKGHLGPFGGGCSS